MKTLRDAATAALDALEYEADLPGLHSENKVWAAITALRSALAEPEQKPLTAEQIEQAYREIWRTAPSGSLYTTHDCIEQGIKYAERAHGITGAHP